VFKLKKRASNWPPKKQKGEDKKRYIGPLEPILGGGTEEGFGGNAREKVKTPGSSRGENTYFTYISCWQRLGLGTLRKGSPARESLRRKLAGSSYREKANIRIGRRANERGGGGHWWRTFMAR